MLRASGKKDRKARHRDLRCDAVPEPDDDDRRDGDDGYRVRRDDKGKKPSREQARIGEARAEHGAEQRADDAARNGFDQRDAGMIEQRARVTPKGLPDARGRREDVGRDLEAERHAFPDERPEPAAMTSGGQTSGQALASQPSRADAAAALSLLMTGITLLERDGALPDQLLEARKLARCRAGAAAANRCRASE